MIRADLGPGLCPGPDIACACPRMRTVRRNFRLALQLQELAETDRRDSGGQQLCNRRERRGWKQRWRGSARRNGRRGSVPLQQQLWRPTDSSNYLGYTGGYGGRGGNGGTGGAAGAGGAGGAASVGVQTTLSSGSTTTASARALGGSGGCAGTPGSGGGGANGGAGGKAAALASDTNASGGALTATRANAYGGAGGSATGAGFTGGAGGKAYIGTISGGVVTPGQVSATGAGRSAAKATATQTGGTAAAAMAAPRAARARAVR